MNLSIRSCEAAAIGSFRERYRAEMACQIVHDSLHRRPGWVRWHEFSVEGQVIGYGASLVAGPWKGSTTFFELYLLPQHRNNLFQIAGAYGASARADTVLCQTNDQLMRTIMHQFCAQVQVEKVIFDQGHDTRLRSRGAKLIRRDELKGRSVFHHEHEPVGHWLLELEDEIIGTGGYLDHYNPPYVDVFLELRQDKRRQGYGSFFLQELKKMAGAEQKVLCGRCDVENLGSRKTMEAAGMIPCGHVVTGKLTFNALNA